MKRFWICVTILAVLFLAALGNGRYLDKLTEAMTQTLQSAQDSAEAGNWARGQALTEQARQIWADASCYLHIVLRHSETDEISSGFREVGQLLQWQEAAEYTSANARLMEEIRLLADMEQFNLKNLL